MKISLQRGKRNFSFDSPLSISSKTPCARNLDLCSISTFFTKLKTLNVFLLVHFSVDWWGAFQLSVESTMEWPDFALLSFTMDLEICPILPVNQMKFRLGHACLPLEYGCFHVGKTDLQASWLGANRPIGDMNYRRNKSAGYLTWGRIDP